MTTQAWWAGAKAQIGRFTDLALDGGDEKTRLGDLAVALDSLVATYNTAPLTEPGEDDLPPEAEFHPSYDRIGAAYPELGYYADVDPIFAERSEPLLADAIDDLMDICRDLAEAKWRAENVSVEDAAWHFRFSYQIHWGKHLHRLRTHLHWKLYD
ncbi:MAG: DUF5063 domain-containing protein [Brevundimonas sp.]|uniref:DUF5063 domain-containing protein n=1 Tax=Brevundimonas sp. TaxID=1871086 RepID=UPI002632C5B4|nr:DUF5063 domain-containing protein [Brevundimonas sp.]MDI6624942.1 DUF5063 domain-containing protein [Brevundimonas sp.]MDQ7812275.1 DUF5063 domain-containing protein [Brevundimonas sp.]